MRGSRSSATSSKLCPVEPSDPAGWSDAVRTTTGAREVAPAQAGIVVARSGTGAELVAQLNPGSAQAPESAARLVVECTDLSMEPAATAVHEVSLELQGPGVDGRRGLRLTGVDPALLQALAARNQDFPAGIDAWFVAPDGATAAIPRSTKVRILGPADDLEGTH